MTRKWEVGCLMYSACGICRKSLEYNREIILCIECGMQICADCEEYMVFDKPTETEFEDEEDRQNYLNWAGYMYCPECHAYLEGRK